jgi:chromosome partitioning protein
MTRVAIMNQKGGVAKTTTTLNLSAAIYRNGGNPIMIDLDPQSHLTGIHPDTLKSTHNSIFSFYQNNEPLSNICIEWANVGKLISSDKQLIKVETSFGKGPNILNRLKNGLEDLEKLHDQSSIIIDCTPNLGVLTLSAIFAADIVIIPIASDYLSIKGAKKIAHTLDALQPILKRKVERRYLLTRYDKRRQMSSQVFNQAKAFFGEDVLDLVIHENVDLAKSVNENKAVFCYNNKCQGAHDYNAFYQLLAKQHLI